MCRLVVVSLLCAVVVAVSSAAGREAPLTEPGDFPAATAQSDIPRPLGSFEILSVSRAAVLVSGGRVHTLDTRPVAKYLAGHIPGAVHMEDESLRQSVSGQPARYLPEPGLARVLQQAGVSVDKPVLVYSDGEDPLAATMTAYALLKAGHPRVLLLDGGFEAWRGTFEVSQEYAVFAEVPWGAAPPDASPAASLDDVRRVVDTDEGVLVDARPAKLYRGEGRGWRRNGHIPLALNVDWKLLVRADNEALFKTRGQIEGVLKDAGLDPKSRTIIYCGTGREATLLYLYVRGVLKWPRVTLYEGSWTEWSANSDLPVAIGEEPEVPFHADGEVLVGAQPTEALLRQFADEGVTTVINVRTGSEMASVSFDEAAIARSLGMVYVEIPLGGNEGFEPNDVEALKRALAERSKGKVVLHCAGGGRATQLWVAHLVANEGLTLDQAQERARASGMLRPSALERLLGRRTRSEVKP